MQEYNFAFTFDYPVTTVLQEVYKSCKFFLARFARSSTKSYTNLASLALKMKLINYLARHKKSCKNLARKKL